MQDDSTLNTGSARKSKVGRAQTMMSDSFRMAASVLGPNAGRKAQTINVPNLKMADKDHHKKQPECQICFIPFGKFGQHHCRICANAVCSSCSYSTINKERACDKCSYHYSDMDRQKFKRESIKNLTGMCVQYLGNKLKAEEQLKAIETQIPSKEEKELEKRSVDDKMKKMNQKLEQVAHARKRLEAEIQSIRSS